MAWMRFYWARSRDSGAGTRDTCKSRFLPPWGSPAPPVDAEEEVCVSEEM